MLVVTTEHIPGQRVTRVVGRVLAVIARQRLPSQAGAGLRKLLTSWRKETMSHLMEAAEGRGANAVVAVRLDHREVGDKWVEISAHGTAVVTENDRLAPAGAGKAAG
jgi:uncharacterized protein YbjQ (UPF0145 family)